MIIMYSTLLKPMKNKKILVVFRFVFTKRTYQKPSPLE